MKKAIQMMMFVAAATMFFAACSKKDDVKPTTAGDNQMIYNGKTYQGEAQGSIQNGFGELSCISETENLFFAVECYIENLTSSYTYDLTKADPDHGLHIHAIVEGPSVQGDDFLDLRYQNSPSLWYFLNGENVSNASAFTSGTAVATLNADKIILELNGTLVNGKPLSFRIVVPRD